MKLYKVIKEIFFSMTTEGEYRHYNILCDIVLQPGAVVKSPKENTIIIEVNQYVFIRKNLQERIFKECLSYYYDDENEEEMKDKISAWVNKKPSGKVAFIRNNK